MYIYKIICAYIYIYAYIYTPIVHKHVFMISHIVGVTLQTSKIWSSNRRQSVTLHWEEQQSRQLLSMSGLCYYSVDCDSALPCCSADQWVSSGQTNSTNVVNLGSLIVYVAFTVWLNRWMHAVRQSCWVNQHGPADVFSLGWGIFSEGMRGLKFANRRARLWDLISLIEAHCLSS